MADQPINNNDKIQDVLPEHWREITCAMVPRPTIEPSTGLGYYIFPFELE